MEHTTQKIDTYVKEYSIVVNKITSLSMKFASGSYFIPIGLFAGISSLYMDTNSNFTSAIIIIIPIILSFYLYNHIRYMFLQFKLSGYARHLEIKINELLEDNVLLWENSIARSNNQNYYESIFLIIIYLCIFILMYYNAYINLSNIIFKNQNFYGTALIITIIYYFFLVFIIFFLISYVNEHNSTFIKSTIGGNINTFKKETFLKNLQLSATNIKRRNFAKLKEIFNIKMYIIILLFLLTPIAFLPLIYFSPQNIDVTKNYNYIIVLGNKSVDNEPSEDMNARMQCLINYIVDNEHCTIVLSGGNGEAALMSNYLEENNIINNSILEEASQSTYQNLRNTKELVSGNVLIVTSDYHIFRTRLISNRLNLDYDFLSAKSTSNTFFKSIKECYAICLEYLNFARN
ncbi:MAG: YdcF family protein [Lachnospiraceae bacterium]|nr:YdcF family protein [Lachnospiraceae bacterium]